MTIAVLQTLHQKIVKDVMQLNTMHGTKPDIPISMIMEQVTCSAADTIIIRHGLDEHVNIVGQQIGIILLELQYGMN